MQGLFDDATEPDRELREESWNRLREKIEACQKIRSDTENVRESLNDSSLIDTLLAFNLDAEIQHYEIRVRVLRKKIEEISRLYLYKKRCLRDANEAIFKKQGTIEEVTNSNALLEPRLQELVELFAIELDGGPAARGTFKTNQCNCVLIDTIRGYHLPYMQSIIGHMEIETLAAISYALQVFHVLARIMDYNFRYPIIAFAGIAKVELPAENRTIPLLGWKKRIDKEKFEEAVSLISKDITQLRSDTGFPTQVIDKTLYLLFDWVRAINGGPYHRMYPRPSESISSPASLITDDVQHVYVSAPVSHFVCDFRQTPNDVEEALECPLTDTDERQLEEMTEVKSPIVITDVDDEPPLEPPMSLHDKIVIVGTQNGSIWVMDHQGFSNFDNVPVFRPHRCAVSRLSVEATGSYILSCANDCRVVVTGIGTDELNCTINVQYMPKCIVMSPTFSRKDCTPSFLVGERSLILYEKKFLGYKSQTLFDGGERDGFIMCCSWEGRYIAFSNDSGTRIFNRFTRKMLTRVPPQHDVDRIRSFCATPQHCWLPNDSLAIGWADTVTVVAVVNVDGQERGEVHRMWHLSLFVSGISYTLDERNNCNEFFIVGLRSENDEFDDAASTMSSCTAWTSSDSTVPPVIQTCVLSPLSLKEYELLSEDYLSNMKLRKHLFPSHVQMLGIPSCNSYFIMGPYDLVVATPYGAYDGVAFRLKYKMWDPAWEMAMRHAEELEKTNLNTKAVGRQMIEGFLNSDRPKAAAARLPQVAGEKSSEWEWAVDLFERHRLSTMLAEVLPTSNPQLQPECYESVLNAALYNDAKMFKKLVQVWNGDLYRTGHLIDLTQWRIKQVVSETSGAESRVEEAYLCEALAALYIYERKYSQALKIYMSTRDPQIFSIIDKHHLFQLVKDEITELMKINSDRALRLLLDNEDSVPASYVMDKIARQPKVQMAYLTKLLARNEGSEFADKAVQLYAEYDRKKLLPFLRKNEHYHINRALSICKQKNYVEETILLLERGGNHVDAINLMVATYKNIEKAVEYCKEQEDRDLWMHLIDAVVRTPEHFAKLLIQASGSLDPLIIIEKIPLDTEIPDLRDSLSRVLVDYEAHVGLQKGCKEAMLGDNRVLLDGFLVTNSAAVYVHGNKVCHLCGAPVLKIDERIQTGLRMFPCGHVFHNSCSTEAERRNSSMNDECIACSEKTRD
ncbi:unnamed protein product [Caenorhabditis auriculariae]|uniref:RING-type domain-containing protein n=1 Tax=Caenorhabditis auriculariae TaxID=2777116 RepID=A0A8S1GSE0_9PELO|nr:unnamed protein product [Caenorhabditis auriculariae]